MNYQNNTNTSEISLHALDIWQIIRSRLQIIVISVFLVFITACVYTELQEPLYFSKTTFELSENKRVISNMEGNLSQRHAAFTKATHMRTQLEIIKSQANLKEVAKQLNLTEKWKTSLKGAAGILKGMVRIAPVRATNLVDLAVYSNEPSFAAEVAKKVRDVYFAKRNQDEDILIESGLSSLKKEVDKQQQIVNDKRNIVQQIMKKLRLIDLGNHYGGRDRIDNQKFLTSENEVYNTRKNITQLETQIQSIKSLSGDQLINAAAQLNLPDNVASRRQPEYQDLILKEKRYIDAGLGNRHPEMKQLRGQLSSLRKMLYNGVQTMKNNLDIQLKIAKNNLKSLQKMHTDVETESIDKKISTVKLDQTREDYNKQNDIYNIYLTRYMKEYSERNMARIPMNVIEDAEPHFYPISPDTKMNMIAGAVAGLVIGIAIAFLLEYLDTSIKTVDEVEKYLQLPVIAVIPKGVPLLHKQSGLNPDAEAYRILRTNIEFNRQSADANSITVVSGGAGEGKSTTLSNLAYICAQGGYTTLMIDADLRRPRLHTYFDLNNSVGLSNYLTTDMDLENVILQTETENLYFMPSGVLPHDATAVLNLRKMSELIADVKSRFDLVLIDSPPILGVSDASVLVSEADLTMIVIQHRKLARKLILRVKQAVESVGGNLLGVVLNNVDINSDTQYQYYTSYYTYYSSSNNYVADEQPATTAKNTKPAQKTNNEY